MSSIVTFYSYKGGVGRSMALANIAVLLARRGLRVLAVDWDLEAPGLERYFSYFDIKLGGPGLLSMCMEARDTGTADFRNFTCSVDCDARYPISLLPSGREQDEAYSQNLETFDWEDFFSNRGGQFIEQLRQQWREKYDIVLIDSRTGLSDTGGICTIQLPDVVVAMFTANYQSLYGVRDVMRLAQRARQSLAYDRMPLSILPVPARWGVQEFQETQVWLDRVTEALNEFYEDWLPRSIHARDVIERIKVPQSAFFGFGEKLAVVEQGTTDPQGMGFVYDKLAAFLASDFKDVSAIAGESGELRLERDVTLLRPIRFRTPNVTGQTTTHAPKTEYSYEIFVSYERSLSEGVLEFVEALRQELNALRGEETRIFTDLAEIRAGQDWQEQVLDALKGSKVLLAFLTPRYVATPWALREFLTFRARALQTGKALLAPLVLRGSNFPAVINEFVWFDLRDVPMQRISSSRRPPGLQREIDRLAQDLHRMIAKAPPFDPGWTVASDAEVSAVGAIAGTPELPTRDSSSSRSGGSAALKVSFTLDTVDGLRQVLFTLEKDFKGTEETWIIGFELREREATTSTFGVVASLDVPVNDTALYPAATAAAASGLTTTQAAHALGPAADDVKGSAIGSVEADDARESVLSTLRR